MMHVPFIVCMISVCSWAKGAKALKAMQILVKIRLKVKPSELPSLNIDTKASVSMQYILKIYNDFFF